MPFLLNSKTGVTKKEQPRVEAKLNKAIDKYYDNIMNLEGLDLVFLKSMAYFEDIISDINQKLHGTPKHVGLQRQLELLDLIKDDDVKKAVRIMKNMKPFRDQIAHSVTYSLEADMEFLKKVRISKSLSHGKKKRRLASFFRPVASSFLVLRLGIEEFPNFIKYVD